MMLIHYSQTIYHFLVPWEFWEIGVIIIEASLMLCSHSPFSPTTFSISMRVFHTRSKSSLRQFRIFLLKKCFELPMLHTLQHLVQVAIGYFKFSSCACQSDMESDVITIILTWNIIDSQNLFRYLHKMKQTETIICHFLSIKKKISLN